MNVFVDRLGYNVKPLQELIEDINIRLEVLDEELKNPTSEKAKAEPKKRPRGSHSPYWRADLDEPYKLAKSLRAEGMMLKDACAQAGLSIEQWYRRQAIEKHGVGRPGGNSRKPK